MTLPEHLRRLGPPLHTRFRRRAAAMRQTGGFSSIEAIAAMAIFMIIATSLVGLLTSSISLQSLARQRTVAEQAAMDQIEKIRKLPYDSVGVVSGNPPGTVAASTPISVRGLAATLQTQIAYVNDPTPTSYATSANYKRVTVSVLRNKDGKVLTRQSTYVAPLARAPLGGINNGTINTTVIDIGAGLNVPAVGATVNLATGPSAPRSDVADSAGAVTFAALTPSGAGYYDVSASLLGYQTLPEDLPTATGSPNHLQIGPGQTKPATVRIYKPARIDLLVKDGAGVLWPGSASVEISSTRKTQTYTFSGGTQSVTSIGGEDVIPGLQYTVTARTGGSTPQCSVPETRYVPDAGYPTVTSSTFSLALQPCPSGTIKATVTWAGVPVPNATVDILGGPNNVSIPGLIADASGQVTVPNVPEGSGYNVVATFGGSTVTQTASVTEAVTTNVSLPLPTASLTVQVRRSSSSVTSATVRVFGGPMAMAPTTLTTPSSGTSNVTFTNLPIGAGYTVQSYKCSLSSNPKTGQQTGQSVASGGTTMTLNYSGTASCPLP
jgi:type II secretory pathway pseudopilin PulG